MTIQQMQYILEVYRTGSISKAAENLFLAQPNLSNSIRSLEQELGFPVFVRSNRGIRPTESGLLVLEQAGQMVECYDRMLHAAERVNATRIRIGGTAYTPVFEAFEALCLEYQDREHLEFSYITPTCSAALEALYLSNLDVAVCLIRPGILDDFRKTAAAKGVAVEIIIEAPIVLRIGPKHPLYNEPEIKLSDFKNYTFVDYSGQALLGFDEMRSILEPNMDRVVTVADRTSKHYLVSASTMYSVGCKLPARLNQQYGFRNIPLGNLHYLVIRMTRAKEKVSPEIRRYLELLHKALENL